MEINNVNQCGKDAMRIFIIVAIAVILTGYLTSCATTTRSVYNVPSNTYSDRYSGHNTVFHQWRKHHQCPSYGTE